jgi:spore coat polysaccharide biosynthesis predicted glycosyltransferase SpsG
MARRPATSESAIDAVAEGRHRGAFVVAMFDLREFDSRLWDLADERTLTVAICDRGGDDIGADIVVNPSDLDGTAEYRRLPAAHLVCRGARYVPLRRAFADGFHRAAGRSGIGFVIGSGSKSEAWANEIVDHIRVSLAAPLTMVVSRTFESFERLRAAGAACGIEVRTGLSAEQMRELYDEVELCVMTGGSAIYEAMAAGAPILCYPILDDMIAEVARLDRNGALRALAPEEAAPAPLGNVISEIVCDDQKLADLSRAAAALVDGMGCDRIVRCIAQVAEACVAGQSKTDAICTALRKHDA